MSALRFRVRWLANAAIASAAMLMAVQAGPAVAWNNGQNGTTLSECVTMVPRISQSASWSLSKTATPPSLDLFRGDVGTVQYTVTATKSAGPQTGSITGTVKITNGGGVATTGLASMLVVTMPPSSTAVASQALDVSAHPVLAPGESFTYSYSIPIASPVAGKTYKVTANTTILNHSGHLDTPFGPSDSASDTMKLSSTVLHNSVTVTDTNGSSWVFSATGGATYSRSFACDADAGRTSNTATITYNDDHTTGPSSTAVVAVNCYALDVSKTAHTSLTRTYTWGVTKSADTSDITLGLHESTSVNYGITVTSRSADSNWAATGTITVHNPAPVSATITAIADTMPGDVTCPPGTTFPLTLAAGGSLTCNYSVPLTGPNDGTNVATATLQNSPSGTTVFQGSAGFNFANADVTYVDRSATLTDTFTGPYTGTDPSLPRTINATDTPLTIHYGRNVGPYDTAGHYTVDNTATVTTTDTHTVVTSSVSIPVTVLPYAATTLTQTVSPASHATTVYGWSIDKSVSTDTVNMFTGDNGSVLYTVNVTKDAGSTHATVNGQVCITNTGAYDSNGLTSMLTLSSGGHDLSTVPLNLSAHPVLAAGETFCYPFEFSVTDATQGTQYTVTATSTILNYSGHLGSAYGPTSSETTTMPAATLVHDGVLVTDSMGQQWTFNQTGGASYSTPYSCNADQGMHGNTAIITYVDDQSAGPSDIAIVNVNCYGLDVTKTANTSLTRTYGWTIHKSTPTTGLTLGLNATGGIDYTIDVNAAPTDSAWTATGTITVTNPAPIAAMLVGVRDVMGTNTGTVDCGSTFPMMLSPGATLSCTYVMALPDASGGMNTATATIANRVAPVRTPAAPPTTDFTATAAVDFSTAIVHVVDDSAVVTDTFTGPYVGTDPGFPQHLTAAQLPATFHYTAQVGPYTAMGNYTVNNTATVTTDDTSTSSTSSVAVPITVVDLTGAQLNQTVSSATSFTQLFTWDIAKSADPSTLNMFTGDSGRTLYTVTATKHGADPHATVTGQVCISNVSDFATEGLASTLTLTTSPGGMVVGTAPLDLSLSPELAAGQSQCYPYSFDIASPSAGGSYVVTAATTIMNYNSHQGVAWGPTTTSDVTLPETPTPINGTAYVSDTNGMSWTFTSTGAASYSQAFGCNSDQGSHENTATLSYDNPDRAAAPTTSSSENGLTASATVTVNCYGLEVTKTATTSLTRTYAWSITKTADPTALELIVGKTANVNYTLDVSATPTDSAWTVSGVITVTNPAPVSATLASVTDLFGETPATVDCGSNVTFPYTLSADSSLTCNYTLPLPGPTGGTNTATALLQNTSAYETEVGPGTTAFTGSANVDFSSATVTVVDGSATISDSFEGPYLDANSEIPVTVTADESPVSLSYTRVVGPYSAVGTYRVINTGTVKALDTSTTSSSTATVVVTVGASGGGGGSGSGGDDSSDQGNLPHTGADLSAPALLLLGIVLTGTGLVAVRRRSAKA